METVFPELGTDPAKETVPETGADTAAPSAAPMSIPRCWPAAYGCARSNAKPVRTEPLTGQLQPSAGAGASSAATRATGTSERIGRTSVVRNENEEAKVAGRSVVVKPGYRELR